MKLTNGCLGFSLGLLTCVLLASGCSSDEGSESTGRGGSTSRGGSSGKGKGGAAGTTGKAGAGGSNVTSSGGSTSGGSGGSSAGTTSSGGSSAGTSNEGGSSAGTASEGGSSAGTSNEGGSSAGTTSEGGSNAGTTSEGGSSAGTAGEAGSGTSGEGGSTAGSSGEGGSSAGNTSVGGATAGTNAGGSSGSVGEGGTSAGAGGSAGSAGSSGAGGSGFTPVTWTFDSNAQNWSVIESTNTSAPSVTHITDDGSPTNGAVEISWTLQTKQPAADSVVYFGIGLVPAQNWATAKTIKMDVKRVSGSVGFCEIFVNTNGFAGSDAGAFTSLASLDEGEWTTLTFDITNLSVVNQMSFHYGVAANSSTESVTFRIDNVRVE